MDSNPSGRRRFLNTLRHWLVWPRAQVRARNGPREASQPSLKVPSLRVPSLKVPGLKLKIPILGTASPRVS